MGQVEVGSVVGLLAQEIAQRVPEVRWASDRSDAGRLEGDGEREPTAEGSLGVSGEVASLCARSREEHVDMGVGDTKREQSAWLPLIDEDARREPQGRSAAGDAAVVGETHRQVEADRGMRAGEGNARCGGREVPFDRVHVDPSVIGAASCVDTGER